MKLSIAIGVHNEGYYISNLLQELVTFIDNHPAKESYEIIIVDDYSTDSVTVNVLQQYIMNFPHIIKFYQHALNNDFASHKNYMNSICTGDWILNLDADETIPLDVLDNILHIIEANPLVEAYWLPRINTVRGLTLKHVQQWYWVLSTLPGYRTGEINTSHEELNLLEQYGLIVEQDIDTGYVVYDTPIIQWPDPQMRLYKNKPEIRWNGKVHERLEGFEHFSSLPYVPEYAIIHTKEIQRQEQQNNYYVTLQEGK